MRGRLRRTAKPGWASWAGRQGQVGELTPAKWASSGRLQGQASGGRLGFRNAPQGLAGHGSRPRYGGHPSPAHRPCRRARMPVWARGSGSLGPRGGRSNMCLCPLSDAGKPCVSSFTQVSPSRGPCDLRTPELRADVVLATESHPGVGDTPVPRHSDTPGVRTHTGARRHRPVRCECDPGTSPTGTGSLRCHSGGHGLSSPGAAAADGLHLGARSLLSSRPGSEPQGPGEGPSLCGSPGHGSPGLRDWAGSAPISSPSPLPGVSAYRPPSPHRTHHQRAHSVTPPEPDASTETLFPNEVTGTDTGWAFGGCSSPHCRCTGLRSGLSSRGRAPTPL